NCWPDFLKTPKYSRGLQLDIFYPEYGFAIEVQGEQHEKYIEFFHRGDKNNFIKQQARDQLKKELCEENQIALSMPYINKYFERKPSNWDILDFLDECDQEPISQRVGFYLSSLETIVKTEEEENQRKVRAQQLLDDYKQATFNASHEVSVGGSQPDRVRYQKWEKERASCEKAVHSVNFYGDSHTIGDINNGSIHTKLKRTVSQECKNSEFATSSRPKKRNKNDYEFDTDGSVLSDDELPITSSVTSKKLSKIGKGIARYGVIFLPECHKNDILRSEFSDYEWRNLENIFRKKDEEISAQTSPPLDKVERILKEFNESIKKSHRSVTCFQLSKHVLNDKSTSEYQYRSWFVNLLCEDIFLDVNNVIRFVTGEVENIDRKNQKDLSKLPEERRPTGWFHDGILKININGNDLQVGFLEVVGNAIIEDHIKRVGDLQKILKAMRLAFFRLEESLREKGVDDEKKLKQKLETFGILVDRRDFAFYAMNYYDGAFLVDEIFSFTIPDTQMQLYLLENIISDLLAFRARTEYLNVRINELLRNATSQRRSRRTMTAVDASPQKAEKTRKVIH
ncbi:16942_t:CDS:10, partial [Funneliformis geosporum]